MNAKGICIRGLLAMALGSAFVCWADESSLMRSVLDIACKDPCRKLDGKVIDLSPRFEHARAFWMGKITDGRKTPLPEWKLLYGGVVQVTEAGLLVNNYSPLDLLMKDEPKLILIRNERTAETAVDGSIIACYAVRDGRFSYLNSRDVRRTIPAWNCGGFCSEQEKAALPKPKPIAQPKKVDLSAVELPSAQTSSATPAELLARDQSAAAKGDAEGLIRMAERYQLGNGVPKDMAKARELYEKAAALGNTDAKAALNNLH